MTLNLSPYDRETAELADAAGTELGARVRAVMAARNNAEAKIARVEAEIAEWEAALEVDGATSFAPVREAASWVRAALDGSGVTPE